VFELQLLGGALPFPSSTATNAAVHLPAQHRKGVTGRTRQPGCHRVSMEHVASGGRPMKLGHKQRGGVRWLETREPCTPAAGGGIESGDCRSAKMTHGFSCWSSGYDVRTTGAPRSAAEDRSASGRRSSSRKLGVEVCSSVHRSRKHTRAPQQGPSQGHPLALARRDRRAAFGAAHRAAARSEHGIEVARRWWPQSTRGSPFPSRKCCGATLKVVIERP